MRLVGTNPNVKTTGLTPLPGKSNYIIGSDPKKWRTNVQNYARVRYEGIYPGIDLDYYGNPRQLEYDFVVAPGADPRAIELAIQADDRAAGRVERSGESETGKPPPENPQSRIKVDANGDLVITTDAGSMRFHKPVVYQEEPAPQHQRSERYSRASSRLFLRGRYVLDSQNHVHFDVASYDKSRPLVIDPYMEYLAYLGGSGLDTARSIAVDGSGNVIVVGDTNSTDFPTYNPSQPTMVGTDAFVTEISPTGDTIVYSTYLGGSGTDTGYAIALDTTGNAYIAGTSTSTDFPTTGGAYQQAPPPAGYGAFVTKLDTSGSPAYSTYIAGDSSPYSSCSPFRVGIAVDTAGNAYTVTQTSTSGLPTTAGAYQPDIGSPLNAFITKLNASGSGIVYATYLGNHVPGDILPSPYITFSTDITVDLSGNAYVVGSARNYYYPTTPGAITAATDNLCPSCVGNLDDSCRYLFVTKLNTDATGLVYSSTIGGDFDTDGWAIAIDSLGDAYVAGETDSDTFPTTVSFPSGHIRRTCTAWQIYFIPCSDAVALKLSPDGSALLYSALIGGAGPDGARSISVDASGDASITGYTDSSDFPNTGNNFQPAPSVFPDSFITRVSADGSTLLFSSYLGGDGTDQGNGIATDISGNSYVALQTNSYNFLVTAGSFNLFLGNNGTFQGGTGDAMVAKVSPLDTPQVGVSIISVTFPDQPIGSSSGPIAVTIGDLSNTQAVVTNITVENDPSTPGNDFSVHPLDCKRTYQPGDRCTFDLYFAPQSSTSSPIGQNFPENKSVRLHSRGGKNQIPLSATGTRIGRCTITTGTAGTANPVRAANVSRTVLVSTNSPPDLPLQGNAVDYGVVVSPLSLSFPKQIAGTASAPLSVTITNLMGVPLTINSLFPSGGFAVQSTTCPLSPSSLANAASCVINVVASPPEGPVAGTLTISDDGTGSPRTVALDGFGTSSQFSVASLTFGPQLVGSGSAPQIVTFSGYYPPEIYGIIYSVSGNEDFGAGGCSGINLANLPCDITVTFDPSRIGMRHGLLTVYLGVGTNEYTHGPFETHYLDLYGTGYLHPMPQIQPPLTPAGATNGSIGFALTVHGTGFVPDSTVEWNGSPRTTTYVSGTQLSAAISSADVATVGTAAITVQNPSTGTSNSVPFSISGQIPHVSLAPHTYPTSTYPVSIAAGDFNGDGKTDLAVVNQTAGSVSIYLGVGDGTLTYLGDFNTGANPTGIAVGDFNRDGNADLVISSGIGVTLLLGNGSGSFPSRVDYQTGTDPSATAVGDFNADGYLDMAIANRGANTVSVLLGYGDATFQGHVDYSTGSQPTSVKVGDFNRDNIPDLAVANFGDNTVSIFLGKGDGTFNPQVPLPAGTGPSSIVTGDFNKDGKLDLAVANSGSNNVSLLLGNGNGTFQPQVTFKAGITPDGLEIGDFNSDGNLDLAVVNGGDNSISLLLGRGSGRFAPMSSYAAGTHPSGVSVGDFNNDGLLDLAVVRRGDDKVSVLIQSPLALAPDSGVSFDSRAVGTSSASRTVTLSNNGSLPITLSSLAVSGGNNLDFGLSHNCPLTPSALASSSSCIINVTFKPTLPGPRRASLSVIGNTVGNPFGTILTGVGTAISLSPAILTFPSQTVGTASSPQAVTLTNRGTTTLNLWEIAFSGPNASDFTKTTTCGNTLAAGSHCTINVTFTPKSTGARSASLLISDNGGASPQAVSLIGNGTSPSAPATNQPSSDSGTTSASDSGTNTGTASGAAIIVLGASQYRHGVPRRLPWSMSFGRQEVGVPSEAKEVEIVNEGLTAMKIKGIELSGGAGGNFTMNSDCPDSLDAGGKCTLEISFSPRSEGDHTAELKVVDDSGEGGHELQIQGTGIKGSEKDVHGTARKSTHRQQ